MKYDRHYMSHSSEYAIWRGILARCDNPRCAAYGAYGGRGITRPRHWDEFPKFLKDVGRRPPGMTLDRIDNNLGYSKENCRWTTLEVQHNNTRANRHLTFRGETLTVAQWCDRLGVPRHRVYKRLKYGWDAERALTAPHRDHK